MIMSVKLVSHFLLCFISCCLAQLPTSANKTDLIAQCAPSDMIVESFFAIEGSPYYHPTLNFSLYNPNGEDQYTDCFFVSQTTPAVYGEITHFCNVGYPEVQFDLVRSSWLMILGPEQ